MKLDVLAKNPLATVKSAFNTQWEKPATAAISGTGIASPLSQVVLGSTCKLESLLRSAALLRHGNSNNAAATKKDFLIIVRSSGKPALCLLSDDRLTYHAPINADRDFAGLRRRFASQSIKSSVDWAHTGVIANKVR